MLVLARNMLHRSEVYRRGLLRIESRADILGGEVVFKGTRVPVAHVGKLARKGARREILEDYAVTPDDVDFAEIYVELHPEPDTEGKPPKPL